MVENSYTDRCSYRVDGVGVLIVTYNNGDGDLADMYAAGTWRLLGGKA